MTTKQFNKLIELILSCHQVGVNDQDRKISSIKTIAKNENMEIAKAIRVEKDGETCLQYVAIVFTIYKVWGIDAWTIFNHIIIKRILAE